MIKILLCVEHFRILFACVEVQCRKIWIITIHLHHTVLSLLNTFLNMTVCRPPCKACKVLSLGGCYFYWKDSVSYTDDMDIYWSHLNMLAIPCYSMQLLWTKMITIFFLLIEHPSLLPHQSLFGWRKSPLGQYLFCWFYYNNNWILTPICSISFLWFSHL